MLSFAHLRTLARAALTPPAPVPVIDHVHTLAPRTPVRDLAYWVDYADAHPSHTGVRTGAVLRVLRHYCEQEDLTFTLTRVRELRDELGMYGFVPDAYVG